MNKAKTDEQNPTVDANPPPVVAPEPKWEETPPPEPKIGRTDDIRRLATALAAAQGEIENAQKSSENPHFKTNYADLAAVVDVLRLPLSRYQIARTQIPNFNDSDSWLDTMLIHGPSGQYISCRWPLPHGRGMKSQDFMAAVTYAKRGSMMAICGVAAEEEDDDGEAGAVHTQTSGEQGEQVEQQAQTPQPTKQRREAEQWAPWAVRKIGKLPTAQALSEWEEKFKQTLVDLRRVFPEGHAEVMAAIQEADTKFGKQLP